MLGNGNATFRPAIRIGFATSLWPTFGLSADVDSDGNLDFLVGVSTASGTDYVDIYLGRGDGTFPDSGHLALSGTASNPYGAAVGDVSGDGTRDVVVANHDGHFVTVFLDPFGASSSSFDIPIQGQANDVAIGDVNRDGKMDLVVATSHDGADDLYYWGGEVQVLRGNGNGTFQAPKVYDAGRGPWKLVLGDFNRDGIPDAATANRSARLSEDSCGRSWDSVSILPGRSDGSFGAASTFSLGDQGNPAGGRFSNSVFSLSAADLNRDGFLDLAASWGAILLNHAPDTNWAPTVSAGPDRAADADHSVQLTASANDVDQDLLTYRWTDSGGTPMESSPAPCVVRPTTMGVHTFTVTVDDGHGHTASDSVVVDFGGESGPPPGDVPPFVAIAAPTAGEVVAAGQAYYIRWRASASSHPIAKFTVSYSTDDGATTHPIPECQEVGASFTSCQWASPPVTERARVTVTAIDTSSRTRSAQSERFMIRPTPGTPFGNGWSHADVGSVGATGMASFDGYVLRGEAYTVTGSGADIWGTADEFHFAWTRMTGDFSIETQVASLENTNAWAKAGLMVRASALDASSVHASLVVSPSKGLVFQRRVAAGGITTSTQGPVMAAPIWLRITRQGTLIRALYRRTNQDAWTTLGSEALPALGASVDVGVAATSHADGSLAMAKFKGVFLGALPNLAATAIGGATGSITGDGTTWTVRGSGSDIWGASDGFLFAGVPIGENESITLRVRSISNTDPWAKAGPMIRESIAANAKHADVVVSPGKGFALQYRNVTGGASGSAVQMSGAAPIYLQLVRFENSPSSTPGGFNAWYSTDGNIWRVLGSVNFVTTHDALAGIAVTSHHPGTETVVVIDDVRIAR